MLDDFNIWGDFQICISVPLNHGLKLIRVHSIISFRQEAWLKPYIDLNTELRKNAENEFEKDFYKLRINSIYTFEFWYDYLKPIYGDKIRLCYTDTDSFIMLIKTDDFYKDVTADVDKWFDTSNYNKNDD